MSFGKKLAVTFALATAAHIGMLAINLRGIDQQANNDLDQIMNTSHKPESAFIAGIGGNIPFLKYSLFSTQASQDEGCLYKVDENILFGKTFNKKITTECKPVAAWENTPYAQYMMR